MITHPHLPIVLILWNRSFIYLHDMCGAHCMTIIYQRNKMINLSHIARDKVLRCPSEWRAKQTAVEHTVQNLNTNKPVWHCVCMHLSVDQSGMYRKPGIYSQLLVWNYNYFVPWNPQSVNVCYWATTVSINWLMGMLVQVVCQNWLMVYDVWYTGIVMCTIAKFTHDKLIWRSCVSEVGLVYHQHHQEMQNKW